MPLFDYHCPLCGHEETKLEKEPTYPLCSRCELPMARRFGVPMVKMKGEGGYPSRVKQIRNTTYRIHPDLTPKKNTQYF